MISTATVASFYRMWKRLYAHFAFLNIAFSTANLVLIDPMQSYVTAYFNYVINIIKHAQKELLDIWWPQKYLKIIAESHLEIGDLRREEHTSFCFSDKKVSLFFGSESSKRQRPYFWPFQQGESLAFMALIFRGSI